MRPRACEALEGNEFRRVALRAGRDGKDDSPVSMRFVETTVRRLNERGLALLTQAAQASDWTEPQASLKEILELWAHASESLLVRAACCPMVLLDFNFQRVAWWNRVINAQIREESSHPRLSAFHIDEAMPFARELLLEAWSAARSMSHLSSLVFGMAPEVTTVIARLSPRDLDRVVVQEIQQLRPRWENRPMFWKEL